MWTREAKGEKVEEGIEWSNARPSKTHMALVELEKRGLVQWLVSQNVDGLHARSGFPLNRFAELHGKKRPKSIIDRFSRKCFRDPLPEL